MAFTLAEAVVFFKGDDSGLSKDLGNAETKTKGFASNATALIGGAVAGAAVAAGAAILGVGAAALDVSGQTRQAAGDIAASLGLPIEEAEKFAEVAKRVYGNNFADSVTDAADAVGQLAKQLGLTADDPALQTMTENAFRLRDSFGVDVAESVDAVKTLMENFGVSSEEAFDMIAAGYQKGLDRSGDFLDTIGEYSTQFANGGASAESFFNLLESGLQGGILGTDKAADAFKEFRVRIQDGSKLTKESLESLGINSEALLANMANGTTSAAQAFSMVTSRLAETGDTAVQMQAGVGLLGTQFEDLGASIATGLTFAGDSFREIEGSVKSLDVQYQSFGGAVEGIWRRLVVSVTPFTDKLLELVNDAMPAVMGAFDQFDATVGPAVENAGRVIDTVVNAVKGFFGQLKTSVDENAIGPLAYWKEWADDNLPRVQQLFDTILGAIQAFWAEWGDEIMFIVNNTFENVFLVIDTVMRTIGDLITLALQALNGDWEGAGATLEGIVTRIWDTIYTVINNQIESLKELFGSVDWGAVGGAIVDGIKEGISNAWEGLVNWFGTKLSGLRNMLPFSEPKDPSSPLRGLGESGEAFVENWWGGAEKAMAGLKGNFAGDLSGLITPLQQPAAMGGGAMNITVNVSGKDATYESGRAVGRGILDEMRRRGAR